MGKAYSSDLRERVVRSSGICQLVAREECGYRWDRGTSWLERVIKCAGKAGLGWGFLQFAIELTRWRGR
jgi:hypothetical protein